MAQKTGMTTNRSNFRGFYGVTEKINLTVCLNQVALYSAVLNMDSESAQKLICTT